LKQETCRDYIPIGRNLRNIRKSKGLKIDEVANKIGCSPSAISMYERGERNVKIERLLELIIFYQLDIKQFMNEYKDQIGVELNDFHEIINGRLKDTNQINIENKVRVRADGRCELCGKHAPFVDRNGEPYLEMYLLDTGEQSTEFNTVALCPNCKAKMKIMNLEGEYLYLKNKIQEKEDI